MEAFHLLTRGGANFNKKRFEKDVQLFKVSCMFSLTMARLVLTHGQKSQKSGTSSSTVQDDSELPAELDFFKYTQGGPLKRKGNATNGPKAKKQKIQASDSEEVDAEPLAPVMGGQRVTAKGKDVPGVAETFKSLQSRYDVGSLLLSNLEKSGYHQPTGIQAHGIPVLLEVSSAMYEYLCYL